MIWPWDRRRLLIEALKDELAAKNRLIVAQEEVLSEMRRLTSAQDGIIETLTERCAIRRANGEGK